MISSPDITSYDVFNPMIEAKVLSMIKESYEYAKHRDKIYNELSDEDRFDEVLFLNPIQSMNEASIGTGVEFIEVNISRNFRFKNYSFNLH